MTYRVALPDDSDAIIKFCEKYNHPRPSMGPIFIAEENGELAGLISGGSIGFIETIIAENPLTIHTLFSMMQGYLFTFTGQRILTCPMRESADKILRKLGYSPTAGKPFYIKENS